MVTHANIRPIMFFSKSPRFVPLFCLFLSSVAPASAQQLKDALTLEIKPSGIDQMVDQILTSTIAPKHHFIKKFDTKDYEASHVDISSAPEIIKVYGEHLFNFDLNKPADLKIKVFVPKIETNIKIKKIALSKINSHLLQAQLDVILDQIDVNVPSVWIKEENVTKPEKLTPESCNYGIRTNAFFKNRVYAELNGISLTQKPKHSSQVHAHLKVEFDPEAPNQQLVVQTIKQDLAKKIQANYLLNIADIQFPKIQVKVNGQCFPSDTSGLKKLILSKLDDIKTDLFQAVSEMIAKDGVQMINTAIKSLSVPDEFTLTREELLKQEEAAKAKAKATAEANAKASEKTSSAPYSMRADYEQKISQFNVAATTYVRPAVIQELGAGKPLLKQITDLFSGLSYHIQFQGFDTLDGAIMIGLDESLTLDGKSSAPSNLETGYGENTPNPSPIVLRLTPDFFLEKIELLKQTLNALPDSGIPQGITFTGTKAQVQKIDATHISLLAQAQVDLNKMSGMASVGAVIEKLFGNTGGKILLPIQVVIGMEQTQKDEDFFGTLRHRNDLKLSVALNESAFDEYSKLSNLDESAALIRMIVRNKIHKLNLQLQKPSQAIDLYSLTESTGFYIQNIQFNVKSALEIGITPMNLGVLFAPSTEGQSK